MSNFNDFLNDVNYRVDVLYQQGTELANKYGHWSLQSLEADQNFMVTLAILRFQFWKPDAAAMLASREVGIEETADGLRVVLAYISTDEDFLTRVGNKAYWLALELSEQAEAAAASLKK